MDVVLQAEGLTLYFSGDTLYDEKLFDISRFSPDCTFICINGKLGNMNVEEAVKLTCIIDPKVGVPTHYGMFESNTEDPKKYTDAIKCGFEMKHNVKYDIYEVLNNV